MVAAAVVVGGWRLPIKLRLSISCVARERKCLFKFENSSCKPFILLIELDCVKKLSQHNTANPKQRLESARWPSQVVENH